MEKLRVINNMETYLRYCNLYEKIVLDCIERGEEESVNEDAATLLLLIQDYDKRISVVEAKELDPVEFLRMIMKNHGYKNADLARELNVEAPLISKILNYKQAMSLPVIRRIVKRFKVAADPFLKNYPLAKNKGVVA